jgi:hypothetical protein
MYRKGEAQLFASPEDVPQGEGWVDSPALVSVEEPQPQPPTKRKRKADGDIEPDRN